MSPGVIECSSSVNVIEPEGPIRNEHKITLGNKFDAPGAAEVAARFCAQDRTAIVANFVIPNAVLDVKTGLVFLKDKIEAQLAALKTAPSLVRSFFKAPSVAYITDW